MLKVLAVAIALCWAVMAFRQGPKNPVEIGTIRWDRSFEHAQQEARRLDKPMLVLFQEVPGWQTCRDFGAHVLSHPDLKMFAEDLFVPVFVQNNTTGDEAERTCKRFGEPAWNNPVVRVVDAEGNDLVPRLSSDWTVRGVAKLMVGALRSTGKECPAELLLLARS